MKWLFGVLVAGCLLACGGADGDKPADKIRAQAETMLKARLDDPNSYEFVSLTLFDSLSYGDNIKRLQSHRQQDLESRIYMDGKAPANDKKMLAGIDSIRTALGPRVNETACYKYAFDFRAKNAFGAKVLNSHIVQVGPAPDYKVLMVASNKGELLSYPNTFPGYDELKARYKE